MTLGTLWNTTRRFLLSASVAVLLSSLQAMAQAGRPGLNPCEPSAPSPTTNGMIVYDSNQGVCWLADADLAGSPDIRAGLGVSGINPNGSMDFATAQKWVAALNAYNNGSGYLGHNNWQLPVAPLKDTTCADTGSQGGSFGPLCTGSALGNLYYVSLNQTFPNSVAPTFAATVAPFFNIKLSYYWALQNNGGTGSGVGGGGQEMFSFANSMQGGTTTKDSYYYVLPVVTGSIGVPPSCLPGSSRVVPYTQGPAASKAVYDCSTGYTWSADANLAASNSFGITGNTSIAYASRTITTPLINGGAMLFQTANQWIQAMNQNEYLGSSSWQMPAASKDLETLTADLNLAWGDARLMWTGSSGPFQNLQPFFYWGCERDQSGNSQSPCTGYAPPDGSQQLQWTFDFNYGFQSTSSLVQRYFVMIYYPAPLGGTGVAGFTVSNRGGESLTSSGAGATASLGYAEVQPGSGSTVPSGVAIFDFHQINTLVSEVGVPATPATLSGRIYAEIVGPVNAGLAIANPNSSPATISFYFTDANGNPAGSGSTTVGANQQIARFLDQSVFKVYTTPTFQGTFSFTSSVPVAVVALRGFTNERGDFLMSTLPVIDTTAVPNNGTIVVPHFADGGGWTTQVFLVNPTDNPMSGTLQFMSQSGAATNVTIAGQTNSSFPYAIAKRTAQKLSTAGLGSTTASGSIRIVPTAGGASPTPLIVFSYKPAGITLSEAGVPVTTGTAFRNYVESSGVVGQVGNIQSGIAVANTSSTSASVTFDITDLTGAPVTGISPVTVVLAPSGQTAKYLSDIFPSLPNPFKGVVRITTTGNGVSVVGLRILFNERRDLLFTTTPPANENNPAPSTPMYFPQVADGGGYTTQFILFSGTAGQAASGSLQFFKQDGSPLGLSLK